MLEPKQVGGRVSILFSHLWDLVTSPQLYRVLDGVYIVLYFVAFHITQGNFSWKGTRFYFFLLMAVGCFETGISVVPCIQCVFFYSIFSHMVSLQSRYKYLVLSELEPLHFHTS
uniref:Uncharacterized protein n=1 Tax=Cacopsylla melanoneura TaxID=428564 RepID=A0A8D8PSV7_9HEMI